MSSDDEDDELRDFQNGDSSSDGDSDSISCDDDDDDSVRLHGDGRTLRTPGLLEVDDLLLNAMEGNLNLTHKNYQKVTKRLQSRDRRQKTGKGIQQESPVKGNKQKSAATSIPQQRATPSEASSTKSASITEAQNYSQGIGAIEVNDDTSLDGGSKKLGSQKSPKLLRTQTTITHPKKRRGRPPKKVTKDADEETTLKGKNCKEAQVYEGVGMKGSKHDMMG
ncbi:hypothetical protein BJV82DRAFT_707859 [Fennellomyces sp. T-0311]|nr:hypothetical protein BJV82DRAFT_707859 [Fennellomyces sp. T-0311]